jgi:hypothetical protein
VAEGTQDAPFGQNPFCLSGEGSLGGMGAEEGPAALADRLFRDLAGALELLTVYLGERLGLYQALYADGPATSRSRRGCCACTG